MGKQRWTLMSVSIGFLILILDSRTALTGAKEGVTLCLQTVIPSLFPFFLLSILLTNLLQQNKNLLVKGFARLFHLPNGTEALIVPGLLGGYPVGSQCVGEAYATGHLTAAAAEAILPICNNAGPAFLFGMVSGLFPEKWMVFALWGIQLISIWVVSFVFPPEQSMGRIPKAKPITLREGMQRAITAMATVCGWIILFRMMISFLEKWVFWYLPIAIQVTVSGLLELSNGVCMLRQIEKESLRFLLCSGMLSFGGFCVLLQTMSVTTGLSLRKYLAGKLLQTLTSILIAGCFLQRSWRLPFLGMILLFLLFRKNKKVVAIQGKVLYNARRMGRRDMSCSLERK